MAANKKTKKNVKKKVTRKKVTKKKTGKKNNKKSIINEIKKNFVGFFVLVAICLTVAMVADIVLQPEYIDEDITMVDKEAANKITKVDKIDNKKPGVVKKKPKIIKKSELLKQKPKIVKKPKVIKKKSEVVKNTERKVRPVLQESIEDKKTDNTVEVKKVVTDLQKRDKTIKYEVFDKVDQAAVEKKIPEPEKHHIPKIVIIIDDIGYDKKIAMALCDLDSNITFSVLPFVPFGKIISNQLHTRGAQLMLHLPMEPDEYPAVNPGPGAILSSMSPDALLDQLKKNLDDVPHIVGVNNHMGSRVTTNSDQMNQIFSVLKRENLFFIDSRTSSKSQCKASARLFSLEFAQRDVFLDNFQNNEYITGQFKKLKKLAKKHGFAIGIGHPYKATLHALAIELPKLENKIEIVKASTLTFVPE